MIAGLSLTRQGLGGAECAHREVFSLVNTHLLCRMKLRVVAVACEITHESKNRVFEIRQRDTGELVAQHRHDQTRGVDDEAPASRWGTGCRRK